MQITSIKAQSFQLFMKAVTCSEIQAILNTGEKTEVGHVCGTAHFVHLNTVEKGKVFPRINTVPRQQSWGNQAEQLQHFAESEN